MRRVLIGVLMVLVFPVVAGGGGAAQEAPSAPATFYGELTVGGEPAPAGTTVEARVDGETVGTLTSEHRGRYGGAAAADPKLVIKASNDDEGRVTVTVTPPDGQQTTADQTLTAEPGVIEEVALTAPFEPISTGRDRSNEAETGGSGDSGGTGSDTAAPPDGTAQSTTASDEDDDPQAATGDDGTSEPTTAAADASGGNSGGMLPVPGFGLSVAIGGLVGLAVAQAARRV